ncbi:MAG TPA: hypothetical protein ENG62_02555, partial [Thermoplasmatales archaeon]|nr:hypothetical protein [Thermoplasmatales archaeon]
MRRIYILLVTFMFLLNSFIVLGSVQKYDLLIITYDDFEEALKPLVKHKESHGVRTKIVTLSKVYDEMFWYGRDEAEKIKYFIKKAYDIW